MSSSSSYATDEYNQMKEIPWNIIQPILLAVHLIGVFFPQSRAGFSLLFEYNQIMLLAVFNEISIDSQGLKMMLSFQFCHFKMLDYTYTKSPPQPVLGYYPNLLDNAYPFFILLILVVVCISMTLCFGLKLAKHYFVRLFYRLIVLGFLPITLFFVYSLRVNKSITNELYVSITAFVLFSLILIFSFLRYLPRNKLDWDWELEDDPTNTFELRRRILFNKWGRQFFNVLIFPLFKLFLVVWSLCFENKESEVNVIVIAISFGIFLSYLAVVRPFDHWSYNMLVLILHACTAIIYALAISGRFTKSLSQYGSYPVIAFLSVEILTTVIVVVITWKIKAQGTTPSTSSAPNNVLVTNPDSEPTFRLMGSVPMQPQVIQKVPPRTINRNPARNPTNMQPNRAAPGMKPANRVAPANQPRSNVRANTVARPFNQNKPNPPTENPRNIVMRKPIGPRPLGPNQPKQLQGY